VLLGVAAISLAACSSSGSSSASTTGAPTTTTTTGGSASSSTIATSTTTPGPPMCRTGNLTVSLGAPNGSAGAIHYGITFQSRGTVACTLYGFPGVSFLNAGGTQIGSPAQRQGGTPATISVAPGGNAYASLAVTDPGIAPCTGSVHPNAIQVYPPGETAPALIVPPSGMLVCSSPNTASYTSASVSPVGSIAT
jgi:hypothetical protein